MDWKPTATPETLRVRAQWLKLIRQFFGSRHVLEVETPALSPATIPDPGIQSLLTRVNGSPMYLQTSPELYMKRLLAAGSGPIFQVARVFRDGEQGRMHQPEFTMLEWYRPGFDQDSLISEASDLVNALCDVGEIEVTSYQRLFLQHTGIDPLDTDLDSLLDYARQQDIDCPLVASDDLDSGLDWLLSIVIQPRMQGAVFVTRYPASQAALAKLDPTDARVARRFELFINGIEMANGFEELTDAGEQRKRFDSENRIRRQKGLPQIKIDERFLAALASGMPAVSGIALGLDRLLMWKLGLSSLGAAMAFDVHGTDSREYEA